MAPKQRRRTKAREIALQALYQLEQRGDEAWGAGLRGFCQEAASGDPVVLEFCLRLVEGCWDKRGELDLLIGGLLEHWALDRVAVIDKCVLRMGAYELLFDPDVPPKVAINEAIDLAKRFSTQHSGVFVNGILDKVFTQHRATQAASADDPAAGPGTTER